MIISCIACFATFFPRNVRKQFPILDDFPVLCCNLFATNVTCVQSFSWLPWHTPFLFHVQLFFFKEARCSNQTLDSSLLPAGCCLCLWDEKNKKIYRHAEMKKKEGRIPPPAQRHFGAVIHQKS